MSDIYYLSDVNGGDEWYLATKRFNNLSLALEDVAMFNATLNTKS